MQNIIKNIFYTTSRQVLTSLISFALIVAIARFYGPKGNGLFAVLLLLPSTLINILNFGIPSSNVYLIGKHRDLLAEIFVINLKIVTIISCFGLVGGGLIIELFHGDLFPGIEYTLLWIALISFPIGLAQVLVNSIFHALEEFKHYNILLILQPSILTLLILFLFMAGFKDLIYLVGSQFISVLVTFLISMVYIKPFIVNRQFKKNFLLKQIINFGLKSHLSNLLTFLNYKIDIFLTNFFLGPVSVGVYIIAVGISERLWILSHSASTVIFPRLAKLSCSDPEYKFLTNSLSRIVIALTLFFSIFIFLIIDFIINIFFGEEYLSASLAFSILLPGIVFLSGSRILSNNIAARGKPEVNLYIAGIIFFISILGNLVFIPYFGIEGAALATSITYFFHLIFTNFVYCKLSDCSFFNPLVVNFKDLHFIRQFITQVNS